LEPFPIVATRATAGDQLRQAQGHAAFSSGGGVHEFVGLFEAQFEDLA
jgi:hypothetical protein